MSLAHPIVEPQMALRACTGFFFGGAERFAALLYSNRIVFKPIDDTGMISPEAETDVVISIPPPPMALGNEEYDVLPNLGGVFFTVGRNQDMLAMQVKHSLVVLSVNAVDNALELQGSWGLPKPRSSSSIGSSSGSSSGTGGIGSGSSSIGSSIGSGTSSKLGTSSSGTSLSTMMGENSKLRKPGLSPRHSGNVPTLASFKGNGSNGYGNGYSGNGYSGNGSGGSGLAAPSPSGLTRPASVNGLSSLNPPRGHSHERSSSGSSRGSDDLAELGFGSGSRSSAALRASTTTLSKLSLGAATPGGLSKSHLRLSPDMPRPKPSPDGTQVFLATRGKSQVHLVLLSSFGQELIRMDVDYLTVLTLGWICDDVVYIVYLNANFHKKFQTLRLGNKVKNSGFLGMGRKASKSSFIPELTVLLAPDFQPSVADARGGQDLVFRDYVLLGTKAGGYVRVNIKSGTWEPVLNARDVLGAVWLDDRALVVQCAAVHAAAGTIGGTSAAAAAMNAAGGVGALAAKKPAYPTHPGQLSYSIISESAVHAIKVDPLVSACLCSKHNIDGDHRYTLKLLHIGNGVVLDFKRQPFRAFQFTAQRGAVPLQLLPWGAGDTGVNTIVASAKLTSDFLVKTETALYTRDPNGDDDRVWKVVDRDHVLTVPIGREGLRTLIARDVKSVYALFEHPAEIRVIDESSSKAMKMKTKAAYAFPEPFKGWKFGEARKLFRNVLVFNMTSAQNEFATFLASFMGATHKTDPVPPRITLLHRSRAPEIPPSLVRLPGNSSRLSLQIFDEERRGFTKQFRLLVGSSGAHSWEKETVSMAPALLDEFESHAFFTELDGPLDGLFFVGMTQKSAEATTPKPRGILTNRGGSGNASGNASGTANGTSTKSAGGTANANAVHSPGGSTQSPLGTPPLPEPSKITHLLSVQGTDAMTGTVVVIPHKEWSKTAIWMFDSGVAFREFQIGDVPAARLNRMRHFEQLLRTRRNPDVHRYELSPEFSTKEFQEVSRATRFRPLVDLDAVVARGIGSGIDAEVYLKSPDEGLYSVFRIQNKRLLESLIKLERYILETRVGGWLPEELRQQWLEEVQGSTMVAGAAFAAFWQMDEEGQREACRRANVDIELIKRIRDM